MTGDVNYPNLRRSFEKHLTRKTTENERMFIKWLTMRSKKKRNLTSKPKVNTIIFACLSSSPHIFNG
jgi:hypothetical protein